MNNFGVYSQVGKLRKAIVHRPEENDQFAELMRERRVEAHYVSQLLATALAASDVATA